MKNTSFITSVTSKLNMPMNVLETLVDYSAKTKDAGIPAAWETVKHSSIDLFTKGVIELTFLNKGCKEALNMPVPFSTHFLFTCTKGEGKNIEAVWSTSLS